MNMTCIRDQIGLRALHVIDEDVHGSSRPPAGRADFVTVRGHDVASTSASDNKTRRHVGIGPQLAAMPLERTVPRHSYDPALHKPTCRCDSVHEPHKHAEISPAPLLLGFSDNFRRIFDAVNCSAEE